MVESSNLSHLSIAVDVFFSFFCIGTTFHGCRQNRRPNICVRVRMFEMNGKCFCRCAGKNFILKTNILNIRGKIQTILEKSCQRFFFPFLKCVRSNLFENKKCFPLFEHVFCWNRCTFCNKSMVHKSKLKHRIAGNNCGKFTDTEDTVESYTKASDGIFIRISRCDCTYSRPVNIAKQKTIMGNADFSLLWKELNVEICCLCIIGILYQFAKNRKTTRISGENFHDEFTLVYLYIFLFP